MLDPLSALGLAAAIVQFVDFSSSVLKGGYDAYRSVEGATQDNVDLEQLTQSLYNFQSRLTAQSNATAKGADQIALEELSTKCQNLARELLQLLSDLKVKSKGLVRTWDSFRQACCAVWNKKKIARLEGLLDDIGSQINSRLIYMIREETSATSRQLYQLNRQCELLRVDLRADLRKAREDLLAELSSQSATISSLGNFQNQQNFFQASKVYYTSLKTVPLQIQYLRDTAGRTAKSQHILKSLTFQQMSHREYQIQEAYGNSFEWIFDNDATPFYNWLTSGRNVFWIHGKAGSGKSTLLKFLARHPKTKEGLLRWAAKGRLVFATYYFWSSGPDMQKSQVGLLQSVLFQILRQCPELIPIASARRWESDDHDFDEFDNWTREELSLAMENILAHGRLTSRFCFFMDGLDEYAGDHYQLVEDFDRLARFPAVKFCVSSRPWNVFKEHYGDNLDLQLNIRDHTSNDMHEYVQGLLENDKRFCRLAAREPKALLLIPQIRDRAEGVFLWLFLVVRSLLRGLNEQDTTQELGKRLAQIPSDLDAYFRKMFDSLDPAYRDVTARAFQIATIAVPVPLMVFWYIPQEVEDRDFALRVPATPMSVNERTRFHDQAVAGVNKWCRDLLEIRESYSNAEEDVVDFLHRTVKDFLLTQEMTAIFSSYGVCQHSPGRAVCMMSLAHAKASEECISKKSFLKFEERTKGVMAWAQHCEQIENESPCDILDELQLMRQTMHVRIEHRENMLAANPSAQAQAQFQAIIEESDTYQLDQRSIFRRAILWPLPLYVGDHLSKNPGSRIGILGFALLGHVPAPSMIKLLLERGVDPNEKSGRSTVWQEFLKYCYASVSERQLWETVEVMLNHGADPFVTVKLPQKANVRDCLHRITRLKPEISALLDACEAGANCEATTEGKHRKRIWRHNLLKRLRRLA